MEPNLVEELLARHQNKQQPESIALTSVITAVRDVVKSQGLKVSPVALFAATAASLATAESRADMQTTAALCTLLAMVLERLPAAFLCAQFASTTSMLCATIQQHKDEASVMKPALACLSTVLAAMDANDWPTASLPFSVLLSFSLSPRPKVRKRAHDGLLQVLASVQGTPVMAAASAALLQVCQKVLPGPEAAVQAGKSTAKRSDAEALLHHTVNNALHLLSLLRLVFPVLSAAATTSICALLLKLYHLNQRFLSRAATSAIASALSASTNRWSADDLGDLMMGVFEQQACWDPKDVEVLLSITRLVDDGLTRLHSLDAGRAAILLPQAVLALSTLLHAEQDGVRFAAAQSMKSCIRTCLDKSAVADAVNRARLPGTKPAAAAVVTTCLVKTLAASRQSSWTHAMSVAQELLTVLGHQGRSLTVPLLNRLDEIAAESAEAMSDSGGDASEIPKGVMATLASAVESLGPEHVLDTLPLHLEEGLNGSGEPRTWLLPLVCQHTTGAHLAYWTEHLLPSARACGALAVGYAAGSSSHQSLGLSCRALEMQIWGSLPAFATWAADTASSFRDLATKLGAAFQNRPDLRPVICRTLSILCLQNRLALKAAGRVDMFAPGSPPCTAALHSAGGSDEDLCEDSPSFETGSNVPAAYSADIASANVIALRELAMSWLPLLCSTFVESSAEQRAPLGDAIAAYASISSADVVAGFFSTAMQKFIQVVRESKGEGEGPPLMEGGSDPEARRGTFTELALCLAGGLEDSKLSILFKAASSGLGEKDSGVQKKSYKALAYLCDNRPEWMLLNVQLVVDALAANRKGVASASRRFRLRCLCAIILLLSQNPTAVQASADEGQNGEDDNMQENTAHSRLISTLVGEIVLSCKEVNQKSRVAANEALVSIAHAMHENNPPTLESGGQGGLRDLFNMVIGGMVGESPHMIAAAVMAQARLLYEFGGALSGVVPELLPAILSLLRSKAREVIKAVLGMLKVVAMRLPAEALQPHLAAILEGILLWASDSKNKFKLKVRLIVEKLARKCGFDAVQAAMPAGDSKLLTHIRKERTRKEVRKSGAAPQEDGQWEAAAARTQVSAGGRTARRSAWERNDVFYSEDGEPTSRAPSKAGTRKTARSVAQSHRSAPSAADTSRQGPHPAVSHPGIAAAEREPVDLLDMTTARALTRRAAGQNTADDEIDDYTRDAGGRMVIKEDVTLLTKRKRGGDQEFGSEDSDDGFGRGAPGPGGKAVRFARSTAGSVGGRSRASNGSFGGKSLGNKSVRSSASKRSAASAKESHHSGNRFKAKKAGGDVKGGGAVEPYAYWPMDRKMLNRRPSKAAVAKAGLNAVVARSSEGPPKHKSKQSRKS